MTIPLPEFVAVGEALTDMLTNGGSHWVSQVGGSTWNVARVMARLNVSCAFAGAVSTDIFGSALSAASMEAGLDTRFLQQVDRAPLLAIVHQLNPPQYFFIGNDSADLHFDAGLLPPGWQAAVSWVHFGGISLAREPLASKLLTLATSLKAKGVSISYDPNFRALMDKRYDPVLREMASLADVIKVSDEDLCGLFRSDDSTAGLALLREMNPRATYLYTHGAQGAHLLAGDSAWHATPPPISVVDTVGAGDASIAGFLYSLMRRPTVELCQHLRFAVAAGAAACLAPGAAPPSLSLIEQLQSSVMVSAG